jgi:hypothetical protein
MASRRSRVRIPSAPPVFSMSCGRELLLGSGEDKRPTSCSPDGNELYYLAPDGKLMAVEIEPEPAFRAGMPKALFRTPQQVALSVAAHSWNLTPDGKRFLFVAPTEQGPVSFTVVLNWPSLLRK